MAKKKKEQQALGKKQGFRPPVVAVLGHVDHGKTSLLDKIRKTNVAAGEAGGITQHIGAYQVSFGKPLKQITLIDTPGHAAFAKMRQRGAQVTDLAVLVIDATAGVKPQTVESLDHIREAKIPFVVAINKMDLQAADEEKVKRELAKEKVLVEGRGGEVVTVPVSAKTGQGLEELLEMIYLVYELAPAVLEPAAPLSGVVIESQLDRARGPLATVLVKKGTMKVGDDILAEKVPARVRAMFDEWGKNVASAGPGKPVEVLGFKEVPALGAPVVSGAAAKREAEVAGARELPQEAPGDKLAIVLKADVTGTLGAIKANLPEEAHLVSSGIGDVSESDILMAQAAGAMVYGFSVRVPKAVDKLAQTEGVKVKIEKVIYKLLEDIGKEAEKAFAPLGGEEVVGEAEIVAEFTAAEQRVAGCRVSQGEIKKTDKLKLMHGEDVLGEARIASMRRGKEDVDKAKKGSEFGAILSPQLDFRVGDVLISLRPKKK